MARLLANRLNAATTYLVDLKRQFAGSNDHLGMVGEVLETLIHQQEQDFLPGPSATPAEFDAGGSAVVTPAGSRAKSYRPGGPSKQWQLGGRAYLPARRLSDSAESESSSRSLFYPIFLTRTGICFA